ncbi:response regulator transcription factor [Bermanella sp. WJH001]|uniref:response regulator transcription factor n=1 Tax=Bermanella sp. WJH001 TaxID=3048005 RepID=UPI0024BEB1D0|nr:response regulator transcription factor [Bermanella sp. WJH001]MDJ1537517.1 response regulator transcription factor [Bermanella sp. WJH001]
MLILLVEDETELAKLVIEYLENEGITCDHSAKGSSALSLIEHNEYDVIILDVNLPDINGFEVCRRYRQQGFNTPTIMLTARSSLDDKSKGFDAGVDDYLIKPFAMAELVMRLQALNQRGKRSSIIKLGDIHLNVSDRQAYIHLDPQGQTLSLTPEEWRLLVLLAKRKNEVVSKLSIMNHLWPDESATDDALKMLVSRLRKAVRQGLAKHKLDDQLIKIDTVRGVGLKLVCP